MAILGRRQPFAPKIIPGRYLSPLVQKQRALIVQPLKLPRRNPFPPIFKTVIQYSLPAAPVALPKSLIVDLAVTENRDRLRSFVFRPIMRTMIQYAAAVPYTKPAAIVMVKLAVQEAQQRHKFVLWHPIQKQATLPVVRGKPKLIHIDPTVDRRVSRHQQQVGDLLNSLLRQGRIVQTADKTFDIGYEPSASGDWNGVPDDLWEALDRIAAALAALGRKP